jgi:hypothetical protein
LAKKIWLLLAPQTDQLALEQEALSLVELASLVDGSDQCVNSRAFKRVLDRITE